MSEAIPTDAHIDAIQERASECAARGDWYTGDAELILSMAKELRHLRVQEYSRLLESEDYNVLQSIARQDADATAGQRVGEVALRYVERLIAALRPFTRWGDVRLDDRGRAIAEAEALVKAWDERHGQR